MLDTFILVGLDRGWTVLRLEWVIAVSGIATPIDFMQLQIIRWAIVSLGDECIRATARS